jgi:hypothetical protein
MLGVTHGFFFLWLMSMGKQARSALGPGTRQSTKRRMGRNVRPLVAMLLARGKGMGQGDGHGMNACQGEQQGEEHRQGRATHTFALSTCVTIGLSHSQPSMQSTLVGCQRVKGGCPCVVGCCTMQACSTGGETRGDKELASCLGRD